MENIRAYIRNLRSEFRKLKLDESMVEKEPVMQFEKWFREAVEAEVEEANAFVLSTVSADGRPSARVLLLRDFNANGFVFYSNYRSRKGNELEQNPNGCFTFYWPDLQRQVRIEGVIEKLPGTASDDYFMSRPRNSRLGAWASPQSEVLPGRKALDEVLKEVTEKFHGKEVTRPDWWGGYLLRPDHFEFWQGRESRLHDRVCYTKQENGSWHIIRVAP